MSSRPPDRRRENVPGRVVRIARVDRDVDEELRFHFDETVEELMADGMSRENAESEARRRFGDEASYRERLASIDRAAERRRRWARLADSAAETLRFALRGVRRSPGLSAGIILAFALGIGANATMFGTLERVLLRPPDAVRDADEVRRIYRENFSPFIGARRVASTMTYPDYEDLKHVSSFSSVGAYSATGRIPIGRGEDARQVPVSSVTGSFWEVMGAQPAIGRFFGEDEDVRGRAQVAVISHGYWRREYGGGADVLGRTLEFGHGPYTIIGVAPEGFTGAELAPVDVWLPLRLRAYQTQGDEWATSRQWWWLRVVARLAPAVPVERAEAEATAVHRNSRREFIERGEDPEQRLIPASLIPAKAPNAPPEMMVARWLTAVSLVVLLIACANVANLLLARTIRQRRESAVRLALGISRGRLIAQTLAEGMLLALIGAVAALVLAYWGAGFVRTMLLPDIAWGAPITRGMIVLSLLAALAAGCLAALPPALQGVRHGVAEAIRESSGGITRSSTRLRGLLSAVQAAFSVLLLVGAGLFVRSLGRVQEMDLGFDAGPVLVARPVVSATEMPSADRSGMMTAAREHIRRVPGVRSVALVDVVPFQGSIATEVRAEGVDTLPTPQSGGPYIYAVSDEYFETLGIGIPRGRGFTPEDRKGAPQVAVVNESMARGIWPADQAIGKCLYVGADAVECTRIVGVVENARRQDIEESEQFLYYVPLAQEIDGAASRALLVRAAAEPRPLIPHVQRAVLAADRRVRFADVQPFRELIDHQLRSWKLGATMFTIFGLLALVVAAIGLFSVLSFDVAQRTREIGLRSALGASRRSIVRIFLARAVRLTAVGAAVGLLAAAALAPRLEELLFDTSPRDPLTFVGVAFALLMVAAAAGLVPAWRAARVDPNIALRAD